MQTRNANELTTPVILTKLDHPELCQDNVVITVTHLIDFKSEHDGKWYESAIVAWRRMDAENLGGSISVNQTQAMLARKVIKDAMGKRTLFVVTTTSNETAERFNAPEGSMAIFAKDSKSALAELLAIDACKDRQSALRHYGKQITERKFSFRFGSLFAVRGDSMFIRGA